MRPLLSLLALPTLVAQVPAPLAFLRSHPDHLEALQRTLEAQTLMDTWLANSGYKGAAARAAALARACGEEGLAEKWGKAKG